MSEESQDRIEALTIERDRMQERAIEAEVDNARLRAERDAAMAKVALVRPVLRSIHEAGLIAMLNGTLSASARSGFSAIYHETCAAFDSTPKPLAVVEGYVDSGNMGDLTSTIVEDVREYGDGYLGTPIPVTVLILPREGDDHE